MKSHSQPEEQKGRRADRGKSEGTRTPSAARRAPVAQEKDAPRDSREGTATEPRRQPAGSSDIPETISESEFRSRVARKAFELYEGRGGESGNEIDDWIQAERLVREELVRADRREPA